MPRNPTPTIAVQSHILWVDSRETPAVQRIAASAIYPEPTHVIKLDSADFMLIDNCPEQHTVGIERKTATDFLGSLADRRLYSQLDRMTKTYSYPMLILEGGAFVMSSPGSFVRVPTGAHGSKEVQTKGGKIMRGGIETGWHHGAVQMLLAAIQRDYPVTVLWVNGKLELSDLLRVMYNKTKKGCYDGREPISSRRGDPESPEGTPRG